MPPVQQREREDDLDDLPAHEPVVEREGGVDIDLDSLPAERGAAKKGGEERRDDDDAPGAIERSEEERDPELRERRRQERRERKEARQRRERELETRVESMQAELQRLRAEQNRGVQRDISERIVNIEGEMTTLQRQYEEAKALKEKAFKDRENPESSRVMVEADEAMAAARERYARLGSERAHIINTVERERQTPKVSPELVRHAEGFMSRLPWYDKSGKDRDSAQVIAIDRALAAEGWDPNTAGYWQELEERVKEKIPHRFEDDEDDDRGGDRERTQRREPPRRRAPTGGTGREGGERREGGNFFHLSAQRVAALKEAGFWEDPVKRAKMIRTYKERDEAEARRRRNERG